MRRFAQGFAAAYLLAAGYFGFAFWAADAVRPRGAEVVVGLAWPFYMTPLFWRPETWIRNRRPGTGYECR